MSDAPAPAEATASTPLVTELTTRRLGPVRRYFVRRPLAMDVVVMAVYALLALLGLGISTTVPAEVEARAAPPVVGLALLAIALGTVALFWRRRHPLLVATAMTGTDVLAMVGGRITLELGVALAVYCVAASRRPRTAWLVLVATAVVSGGTSIALGLDNAVLFFSLVAITVGISVRNRRLHVAELVERTNALARERDQHARLAQAAERARIAREMHDVVAHNLAVMIALADGADAALGRDPVRAREAMDRVGDTGRSALADMRRVLGVLHEPDAPFEPQPGGTDLGGLVEQFRSAGLPVRASGLEVELPADAGLQLAVFRIVSEALTNVLRHAPGTAGVDLELRGGPRTIEVEVRDEGPAVAPEPTTGGQGLIGMTERAAVYRGTVEAGPHGRGWRVLAVLHWAPEDER